MKLVIYTRHDNSFWTLPDTGVEDLKRHYPQLRIVSPRDADELNDEIRDADIYFGWAVPERAWNEASRLKWIHIPQVGVGRLSRLDGIDRVTVTNADQMDRTPVAELALSLFLSLYFAVPDAVRMYDQQEWAFNELRKRMSQTRQRQIGEMCTCVVGYGGIGRPLVNMIRPLFRETIVVRKTGAAIADTRVYTLGQWKVYLPETDVLFLAIPGDEESRGFLNHKRIEQFQRPPFVVNVGRGHLVNTGDLVDALAGGRVIGYGADVTHPEPPEKDSPLWNRPDVLITPHVGAYRPDFWDNHVTLFRQKLDRFLQHKPLDSIF